MTMLSLSQLLDAALAMRPPAVDTALVLRGRLALDGVAVHDTVDAALKAACVAPGPSPKAIDRAVDDLQAALAVASDASPFLDPEASDAVAAAIQARDEWWLTARGLAVLGVEAAAPTDAVARIDALLRGEDEGHYALAELAAARRADAALGEHSGWALLPIPRLDAPDLGPPIDDPGDLISDAEIDAVLAGQATPLLARMVDAAAERSPSLQRRLNEAAAILHAPVETHSVAPAWWRGLQPVQLPDGAYAATDAPPYPPPAAGSLVWAFSDGSTLHVERAAAGWLVTLMPAAEDTDFDLSAEGCEPWTDADGHRRILGRPARVTARVAAEVHRLDLPSAPV